MKDNCKKRLIDASEHQPAKQLRWGEDQVFFIENVLPTLQDLKQEIEHGNPKRVAKYLKQLDKNEVKKLIVDENTGEATSLLYYFFHNVDLKAKKGHYDSNLLKKTVEQFLKLAFTETCIVFYGLGAKMSCTDKNPYYSNLNTDFEETETIYMKSHGITGYGQDSRVSNVISIDQEVSSNNQYEDSLSLATSDRIINPLLEESGNIADNSDLSASNNERIDVCRENEKKEISNSDTKTSSATQNDNLSVETENRSDSCHAVKTNNILSQLQEHKPNVASLELKSKLDNPEVHNDEKQEIENAIAEIELNLESQQVKVTISEYLNSVNETIWDDKGLYYINHLHAIYKPESTEKIILPPSNSIIISDLLPKIDPITFLGTFSFGQKQAAGIDLPNIGFMEDMFL